MSSKPSKTKGKPSEIDIHVGKRLRVRRSLLGITQEKLSEAIGITFQQVQKYEKGTNRISAGRLFEISTILEVPIAYFYENIVGTSAQQPSQAMGFSDNEQEGFETLNEDILQSKETLNLLKHYYAIKDPTLRKDVLRLLKTMSATKD